MKKFWKKFKHVFKVIGGILLIGLVIVPCILWYLRNREDNKVITLYPKFTVKKVRRKTQVDKTALDAGIRISKEIMQKMTEESK